ncbi:ribosomal RNA large subunit methyltransferase E-like [Vigna umbellata]|uniref:ribosomal RNA large subunit methyltransferase E-like n=1 Tax=Vigna umbellata TaxID=87088 RepID=UPI001F5E6E6F|nr:ribosomal RNA large subunit methyltransferase E-like [Vigna umbellata]
MGVGGTADFFYKEAQRLSYVAPSAFKLLQIQVCTPDLDRGATVLDLGCVLGRWLKVACQSLGPFHGRGSVLGVDTKKVKVLLQVSILGFRPSLAGFDFWMTLCRLKIVDEDEWRLREVRLGETI